MGQPEGRLQKKIQEAFRARGAFIFKVHGSEYMMTGLPDLIACYRGYFVAIEVKMPGNTASPIQQLRLQQIDRSEGLACVAYGVPEALELLDAIDALIESRGIS